jgi:hypothetical protein
MVGASTESPGKKDKQRKLVPVVFCVRYPIGDLRLRMPTCGI